jgi:hypothetical protein
MFQQTIQLPSSRQINLQVTQEPFHRSGCSGVWEMIEVHDYEKQVCFLMAMKRGEISFQEPWKSQQEVKTRQAVYV